MENEKLDTELIQQVAQTKEWSKGAERRIQKLEKDNEALNKLTIIVEMLQKTMESIDETLSELKDGNKEISHEIKGIKKDVSTLNVKVENIESADKVSIRQFFRKYGAIFFGAIITGLAGFVLIKFGIK